MRARVGRAVASLLAASAGFARPPQRASLLRRGGGRGADEADGFDHFLLVLILLAIHLPELPALKLAQALVKGCQKTGLVFEHLQLLLHPDPEHPEAIALDAAGAVRVGLHVQGPHRVLLFPRFRHQVEVLQRLGGFGQRQASDPLALEQPEALRQLLGALHDKALALAVHEAQHRREVHELAVHLAGGPQVPVEGFTVCWAKWDDPELLQHGPNLLDGDEVSVQLAEGLVAVEVRQEVGTGGLEFLFEELSLGLHLPLPQAQRERHLLLACCYRNCHQTCVKHRPGRDRRRRRNRRRRSRRRLQGRRRRHRLRERDGGRGGALGLRRNEGHGLQGRRGRRLLLLVGLAGLEGVPAARAVALVEVVLEHLLCQRPEDLRGHAEVHPQGGADVEGKGQPGVHDAVEPAHL
mmetsp:Transcript_77481/g.250765  ORF Transcript_77481/g.250765 Transcript_77481/m.250765 type:complete len:409 (+) Transcript_77481:563-1789(+)